MEEREFLNAAIETIAARFRSGNRIPVDKAQVPAEEWHALIAALRPMGEPYAWITRESVARLAHLGGNKKGAVPVHRKRSRVACIPLYRA